MEILGASSLPWVPLRGDSPLSVLVQNNQHQQVTSPCQTLSPQKLGPFLCLSCFPTF